jgi:hypothetical protein
MLHVNCINLHMKQNAIQSAEEVTFQNHFSYFLNMYMKEHCKYCLTSETNIALQLNLIGMRSCLHCLECHIVPKFKTAKHQSPSIINMCSGLGNKALC